MTSISTSVITEQFSLIRFALITAILLFLSSFSTGQNDLNDYEFKLNTLHKYSFESNIDLNSFQSTTEPRSSALRHRLDSLNITWVDLSSNEITSVDHFEYYYNGFNKCSVEMGVYSYGVNYKKEFKYNDEKELIKINTQNWNDDLQDWEPRRIDSMIYDVEGRLSEKWLRLWYGSSQEYYDYARLIYTYNNENQISEINANAFGSQVQGYKDEYYYDSNGDLLEIIRFRPDINDKWIRDIRYLFQYFKNVGWFYKSEYDWNSVIKVWEITNQLSCKSYDESVEGDSLIVPYFPDNRLFRFKIDSFEWNYKDDRFSSGWDDKAIYELHYSQQSISSTSKILESSLRIFPNPVMDYINITVLGYQPVELTIFDLNGKRLLVRNFCNSSRVDLSNFDKGFYFCRIGFKDFNIIRKIVKL